MLSEPTSAVLGLLTLVKLVVNWEPCNIPENQARKSYNFLQIVAFIETTAEATTVATIVATLLVLIVSATAAIATATIIVVVIAFS